MASTTKASGAVEEARLVLLAGAAIRDSANPADALLVLLSGPLSHMHGSVFDATTFQSRIREMFGWDIPIDALNHFVPRLKQLGWLKTRAGFPSGGPFVVDLQEPESEADIASSAQGLTELGAAFQSFAAEVSPINLLPNDPLESGAILLRFVVDAPAEYNIKSDRITNELEYLSARFSSHIAKNKLPERELLSSLSAVGFLFKVAETIARPARSRRINVKVILDGPLILDLLGSSGPERQQACLNIFDSLRAIGGTVATYSHCVDEARDALSSVLRARPLDRFGPTGEALRKGWVNENALRALLPAFDTVVRTRGIEILNDMRGSIPASERYFDDQKAADLESRINWHPGLSDLPRIRDADTAVITIRKRAFHRSSDVFDSRYLVVTSNDTFAGAIKRYLLDTAYYNRSQVPPIVTLKELAAKVWFETGHKGKDEILKLPTSQLVLACDRSLRLNRKVVEKAKLELAKIGQDQLAQFELLLETPRSARAVMDFTLNSERYVTGNNIEQLVEAAVMAAGEEASQKERNKLKREREKHALEVEKLRTELAETAVRLSEEEQSRSQREQQLHETTTRVAGLDEDLLLGVARKASARFRAIRVAIRLGSGAVAALPLFIATRDLVEGNGSLVSIAVTVLAFVFASATLMDRPGAWLSRLIHRLLDENVVNQLRSLGRHDLAEVAEVHWKDGEATIVLNQP